MTKHKAILAAMTAGTIALGSALLWAVSAKAEDANAQCITVQILEDNINSAVPDVRWGEMNEADTQNLVVAYNAQQLPENAVVADKAVIGWAPTKKTVLIGLLKDGCLVKITYMSATEFLDSHPGVL